MLELKVWRVRGKEWGKEEGNKEGTTSFLDKGSRKVANFVCINI